MKAVSWFATKGTASTRSEHDGEDEEAEDQERRPEPAEAEPLEAVGDGIEEVGERQAGDEGQEDVAQEVERERDGEERREPERQLTLDAHACLAAGSRSGLKRGGGRASSPRRARNFHVKDFLPGRMERVPEQGAKMRQFAPGGPT